ncbi:ABC transporter permease [Aureimonas fodinaquatilis]|uniref:ABC transporter permease n=1 Tax=Aureimonas fodinaquatilis TaxID=2565783 RepID=A0A5B0DRV3_9HYPH|nr:ABC transporter permease [Aureimonas fodinaquatilis]KAA0969534.1 ABC transporter permease [Aureimonas fodinaquatilis]
MSASLLRIQSFLGSDLFYSFKKSKLTVVATLITFIFIVAAFGAPWLAPHDPYDLTALNLMDALLPPAWVEGGTWVYPLGTDNQGRDVLSTIMYGMRLSLIVGMCSVLLAMVIGIILGLVSGYFGGVVDTIIMRIADVQLTFPAILVALLVDGVIKAAAKGTSDNLAMAAVIFAIGLSFWVQYARTVRGSTMVERGKEYVMAARVLGLSAPLIMWRHLLRNIMTPVLVIGTINLALAIVAEATLSFLGVGIPSTQPSLGTLIRIGNDYIFSGEWWITLFPAIVLGLLVLSVNLLGDWLRDALNPRLK